MKRRSTTCATDKFVAGVNKKIEQTLLAFTFFSKNQNKTEKNFIEY